MGMIPTSYNKTVHLRAEKGLTACGKYETRAQRLTTFPQEVTCRKCRKTFHTWKKVKS